MSYYWIGADENSIKSVDACRVGYPTFDDFAELCLWRDFHRPFLLRLQGNTAGNMVDVQRLPTNDFVTTQGQGSTTFKQPALDGSLSFPMMVDWHAEQSPKHTWAVYPQPNGELQHVTWRHVGNAMQKVATLIQSKVKAEPGTRPVIAVLAFRDTLTYNATMVGILRAGFVAFLISPRNAQAGVVHLLKVSNAVAVIGSSDHLEKKLIDGVKADLRDAIQVIEAPVFTDIFDLTVYLDAPYEPLLPKMLTPEDNNQTCLIIHSSGSTAFPKPIPLSFIGALQWARIPCYGEADFCDKRVGIQSAPPFHGMGFFHVLGVPIASGSHIAAFAPQEPPVRPTPQLVIEAWKQTKVQVGTGPPSNLVEWVQDPSAVKFLKTLEWLRVGGGPLPTPVGDALVAQGVRVLNGWGTTEVGVLSQPCPKEHYGKDWEYIQLTRNASPIFEERDGGYHEICFPCTPTHIPSVFNDHENRIYRTSDLVELHPTRKGFFRIAGRTDDQLMLSTGEKTNPGPLENIIKGSPLVKGLIYFGRGRFQNGILVEPSSGNEVDPKDDVAVARFRNGIWDLVQLANNEAPTHSRIFKEMILVGSPDKPFLLTPKGTVSRPRTLDLYAKEIDNIYIAQEDSSQTAVPIPDVVTPESIEAFVSTIVTGVMRPDGGSVAPTDLFLQGCDSLQATVIRNRLLGSLRQAGKKTAAIPANWVYVNSTIPLLSASFFEAMTSTVHAKSAADLLKAKIVLLESAAKEYTESFPKHSGTAPLPPRSTVILTGATGTLGSYLLQELFIDSTVEKIYAINRPSRKSGAERQAEALVQRGLDPAILKSERVVLVDADLAQPDFSIPAAQFKEMQNSVTLIIHNAWRLDFNLSLASFKPNIEGVKNLVNFSLGSPFKTPPPIFNTSSVSVFSTHPTGWVAEETANPAYTAPTGYGQSKFVAERILESAPLVSSNIRIGQLSGSHVNGAWNVSDWLPMLIKSSQVCGCLPAGNDDVCWLPTDAAARAIIDFTKCAEVPQTLHIVHPSPIKWSTIISHIAKELNVPVVPFDEWVEKLSKSEAKGSAEIVDNPAIKILPFFRARPLGAGTPGREAIGIPRAKTNQSEASSQTMATLKQLDEHDFDQWLSYWRAEGFLPVSNV